MSDNDPITHSNELPGIRTFVELHVGIVRLAHNDMRSLVLDKDGSCELKRL